MEYISLHDRFVCTLLTVITGQDMLHEQGECLPVTVMITSRYTEHHGASDANQCLIRIYRISSVVFIVY